MSKAGKAPQKEPEAQPVSVGRINFEVPINPPEGFVGLHHYGEGYELPQVGTKSPVSVHVNTPLQYTPITVPKKKKVCIVGTAPQWQLAPFDDPEWEIWGIFGVACAGKRLTRLYELHDKDTIIEQAKATNGKYFEIAASMGDRYITQADYEQCPNASKFDFKSKLDKYGEYFASSAAWLIADAIDYGADEIAIYGVNMASDSEYAYQKPSCTFMIGWAKAVGIKVFIPPSSELLSIPFQYGIQKRPRALCAIDQKKAEVNQQLSAHTQNQKASEIGAACAQSNLQLLQWVEQNWK